MRQILITVVHVKLPPFRLAHRLASVRLSFSFFLFTIFRSRAPLIKVAVRLSFSKSAEPRQSLRERSRSSARADINPTWRPRVRKNVNQRLYTRTTELSGPYHPIWSQLSLDTLFIPNHYIPINRLQSSVLNNYVAYIWRMVDREMSVFPPRQISREN